MQLRMASDDNRTEWSSIKSVTVQVSGEIGQAGSENPTCYQSIIKDNWMKQSPVINQNYGKILDSN